jgi:hypothetical protein
VTDTPGDDDRSWVKSGEVRRDAEPHRGHFLRVLANASVACVLLSLCSLFPSVIELLLGLTALVMALGDLGKMRGGVMDARGKKETQKALGDAFIASILNLLLIVVIGLVLYETLSDH